MENRCGDRGHHYYDHNVRRDACVCGQIPTDIFFAKGCSCGGGHNKNPIHTLECTYVQWAIRRNDFIRTHRINPPIQGIHYKTGEVTNEKPV